MFLEKCYVAFVKCSVGLFAVLCDFDKNAREGWYIRVSKNGGGDFFLYLLPGFLGASDDVACEICNIHTCAGVLISFLSVRGKWSGCWQRKKCA